jgi:tRNA threonylcarbamoyladenosine biosynthesis protein TsaB
MKLLALETATNACSVALWIDGEIRVRHQVAPRQHARLILPMCDELLSEAGLSPAQLDCIAFGRGPGSFTGVRIACASAQGMAFALNLPVVPVSTLEAMAQGVMDEAGAANVLVALDARMGELYFGVFNRDLQGLANPLSAERLIAPEHAVSDLPDGHWHAVGDGWKRVDEDLRAKLILVAIDVDRLPHASHVARLAQAMFSRGEAVSAENALPVYLRDQVAEKRPV